MISMLHEKINVFVEDDEETGTVMVSIEVMGVRVFLACFDSREQADEFIKVMFDKLNSSAKFVAEYTIV